MKTEFFLFQQMERPLLQGQSRKQGDIVEIMLQTTTVAGVGGVVVAAIGLSHGEDKDGRHMFGEINL